jgi:hypothetical protein
MPDVLWSPGMRLLSSRPKPIEVEMRMRFVAFASALRRIDWRWYFDAITTPVCAKFDAERNMRARSLPPLIES